MRISVVTPFRDPGRLLREAVESVLAQTHEDWELLLVDDGCRDGSETLARELATRAPGRIRVLAAEPDRRGAAAARNRGIAAASADWVAFLDADDLYLPERLAADVRALRADASAACVIRPTRWWFDGIRGRDWTERLGIVLDRTYGPPELFVRLLMQERGDVPCTCGVTIRKTALAAVGGFEERFALYEDQALWAKVFLAFPVRAASGCYALYRQHALSTSAGAVARGEYDPQRSHAARVAWLEWLALYARRAKASPAALAAVEGALREARHPRRGGLRRRLRRLGRYLPRG